MTIVPSRCSCMHEALLHSAIFDSHPTLCARGDLCVVRHHHEREACRVSVGEKVEDAAARFYIEVSGGFIGEQHLRPIDECAGDRDALTLTARQFGRTVAQSVAEAAGRE